MRVQEAIEKADRLRPNRFSDMEKIEWLSMLDGQVYDEVISRDEEHMNEDLLIPDTYAKVYVDYLMAQIDFYNRDMGMYNNQIAVFSNGYQDFKNWYIRNHMPMQPKRTGV